MLGTSHALVALYDRTFLLGQSFMPAVCDLLLRILLFKSRLVPRRRLSVIGIVVGPLLLVGSLQPVIDRTYPLADTVAGLQHVEAGHARGKVVMTVA